MSRAHTSLNADAYRGVILRRATGTTSLELKTYVRSDGATIQYHSATVIGPYSTRGAAQGQVTQNARYLDDPQNVDAFVERVPAYAWEVC